MVMLWSALDSLRSFSSFFFFFQAEDGIRDLTVTGVQTCALPISPDLLLRRVVLTELVDVRTGDHELKERVQALRRGLGRRVVPGRSPVHGDHFDGGQQRATPIGELRRRGRYHSGGRRGEPADTAHRDDANRA